MVSVCGVQHALSRTGGVIFSAVGVQWAGAAAALGALWARAAAGGGLLAWPRRAAVTSLTHPRMFHYLRARIDDFLFVQMLDAERLVLARKPAVADVMRPWIQCALTLDCIMPIGTAAPLTAPSCLLFYLNVRPFILLGRK